MMDLSTAGFSLICIFIGFWFCVCSFLLFMSVGWCCLPFLCWSQLPPLCLLVPPLSILRSLFIALSSPPSLTSSFLLLLPLPLFSPPPTLFFHSSPALSFSLPLSSSSPFHFFPTLQPSSPTLSPTILTFSPSYSPRSLFPVTPFPHFHPFSSNSSSSLPLHFFSFPCPAPALPLPRPCPAPASPPLTPTHPLSPQRTTRAWRGPAHPPTSRTTATSRRCWSRSRYAIATATTATPRRPPPSPPPGRWPSRPWPWHCARHSSREASGTGARGRDADAAPRSAALLS